ncbi:MAG: hypothetical protein J3R72DRAFT_450044 [Linnemannia gamsii]|nr:MAG: hypothetical protein J3R72DRAFT_450044 [Linnemannia gamsii]
MTTSIITPDCITTDAGATTFYGIKYQSITPDPVKPSNTLLPASIVLFKSNTNPASPTDLSWSVVSRIDSTQLMGTGYWTSGTGISCAISPQGVFTAFIHDNEARGVRYDPAGTMDPSYNVKGSWTNVVVDPKYLWTSDFELEALGYVLSGSTNVLVHVIFSKASNMLQVATVNDATNTLTGTGVWPLNKAVHGEIKALSIGNDHLYTIGEGIPGGAPFLIGYPLATISASTPTNIQSFDTTQARRCYSYLYNSKKYIYFNHNTLTLVCPVTSTVDPGTYYTIKDPNNAVSTGPPTNFTVNMKLMDMAWGVPIGDGIGASSFLIMRYVNDIYVLGNENGSKYHRQINKISVVNPVGINNGIRLPTPSSISGGNGGKPSSQDSSSSVGVIIGAIVSLVVLAGFAFFIIKRRRTIRNKGTAGAASFKTELPLDQENYTPPQQPGQNLATSYPVGLNEPNTILPMAPISSAPQKQTYQDQMAGLELSSHPRPNFVMSSQDGQHSDISAGAPGSTAVPWRPTAFVPPAQFDGITGMPSPSVGYYSPAATTFSSDTAQSSHGPQTYADDYDVPSATAQSSHGPQTFADANEVPMVGMSPRSLPPLVPHVTRPNSEVGSPHTFVPVVHSPHT